MRSIRWRTAAPTAVAVALLTAACGSQGSAPETADPTNAAASASTPPDGDDGLVADPEHVVDPPGPREGAALGDDMLVFSAEPLSDDIVQQISDLDGVLAVDQFSMGQVDLENKVVNVAAVDPGTYRNFTPPESADTQEVWDRVAGGEMAVDPTIQKKLPTDKEGYLDVGSGAQTSAIHVGAFAPQVSGIDAVVNSTWTDTLGMPEGNALVLQTGSTSPESLRKPIDQIIDGSDVSVQALDVVAQYGLDPKAQQLAVFTGSFADAVGTFTYTSIGDGRIAPDPRWVSSHIVTQEVPILGPVTCNKYLFPQLEAALREVQERGLADEIHPSEYGGCYVPRFIAGSTSLSNHSFGLALDMNVPGNGRGTVGEMDRGVVDIFKKWGFAWGGDWQYTDPMHFELDHLVSPGGAG